MTTHTNRRDFLKAGGAAVSALVIGIPSALAAPLRRLDDNGVARDAARTQTPRNADDAMTPSQYLRIDRDGSVTITVARSEMGQGVRTALPMILAEELGANLARVTLVQASPSATFKKLGTGGSTSVSDMYDALRRTGAAAREMLVSAAATQLGVPSNQLTTSSGAVVHAATARALPFGTLVAAAAKLPVPQKPSFKDAGDYTVVGKPTKRVDGPDIVHGKAAYGLDVRRPGMQFAAIAMSPVPGGTPAAFNRAAALAVAGVKEVVELPRGIAVVASNTWSAFKGRDALAVTWNDGRNVTFESTAFRATLRARTSQKGDIKARDVGNVDSALAAVPAARRFEASYDTPFQSHATMEPQNCTAHVTSGACELWLGTQEPGDTQRDVAKSLGLTPEQVKVNVTLLGGGFGRRITNEYASDAALLSRKVGTPVQLVWSRPDDFAHDLYHPMFAARIDAALDAKGMPVAWRHRIASPAVTAVPGPVAMEAETLGARDIPYAIPNLRVEYTHVASPMSMGWWRAIQFVPNVFARESFIDELAAAARIDPLEYRLQLLNERSQTDFAAAKSVAGAPSAQRTDIDRLRAVLLTAAEKSGWSSPSEPGFGRGIACLSYDDRSYVAQVADVSVSKTGQVRVTRITTAIDVGLVINPLGLIAQVESGIVWALTNALYGDMRFERGRAARTSFAQYRVPRMSEMPLMETHLMTGKYAPSGAGEPPVPAVAPAIANAIFAATGKRVRSLPIVPLALG